MRINYSLFTVILMLVAGFVSIFISRSHFGYIDMILVIFQTLAIFIFAVISSVAKTSGIPEIGGTETVAFISLATMGAVTGLLLSLSLLEITIASLGPIFYTLVAMPFLPSIGDNKRKMRISLVLCTCCLMALTIFFGLPSHYPGGWILW